MARKKKIETENTDGPILSMEFMKSAMGANRKKLEKDFGDIFIDAKTIIDKKRTIFPVSPKLDIALSGGIPSGCWGIFSGVPKLGKSTNALSICAKAQKPEYGSRKCYYFDIEHRLEKKNLEGVPGLDLSKDKFEVIASTAGNILTAEKALSIAENLLKNEPGIVLVLDSSSALCTDKEFNGEMSATGRNEGPRLLAQFTRKLGSIVPVQDSLVIIIQHLIANTSGYGVPYYEDGGNKITYQVDFKLRGVSYKKWEIGDTQVGQVNNWHILYSALGQPGNKVESYLRYGSGIDETWELIELACDIGLINKSGAWFNLDYLDVPEKLQGQAKVWDFLKNNTKSLELLNEKVKEFYYT